MSFAENVTPAAAPAAYAQGVAVRRFRNLADQRSADAFKVTAVAQTAVHAFVNEQNEAWNQDAEREADEENVARDWCGWAVGAHRWCDDAGVVGRECQCELVFFSLLEQIEIEGFLDFLLAFYGQRYLACPGDEAIFPACGSVASDQRVELGLKSAPWLVSDETSALRMLRRFLS